MIARARTGCFNAGHCFGDHIRLFGPNPYHDEFDGQIIWLKFISPIFARNDLYFLF